MFFHSEMNKYCEKIIINEVCFFVATVSTCCLLRPRVRILLFVLLPVPKMFKHLRLQCTLRNKFGIGAIQHDSASCRDVHEKVSNGLKI